jgi:hypothetical protein
MVTVLTENKTIDHIKRHVSQANSTKIAALFWGAESIKPLANIRHSPETPVSD